ncbi:MAG: hypothetical protein LN563_00630 [Rickettsia endosymbiont of Platyusa sonomae]|nr:hypothetical protein [Rickettsia endosymbiont of Platyusa sonomae]
MTKNIYSNLQVIEKELQELSRDVHREEIIKSNLEYVKSLANRNIPTLLIKEILSNNDLLKTVAERSYEHVNHFDKIVLVDNNDPNSFRLTLHSWNCNYGKEIEYEELIHNHRFSFWSHIYRGTLLSESFVEATVLSVERKLFNRYIYTPSTTGNIHTCTFDKKSQLIKLESVCVTQGETYYLNFNTTHRVILPKSGINLCTFVLRGPREREYTNTYNTFYPDRGIASSVPMMTISQLQDKLIAILGEFE